MSDVDPAAGPQEYEVTFQEGVVEVRELTLEQAIRLAAARDVREVWRVTGYAANPRRVA